MKQRPVHDSVRTLDIPSCPECGGREYVCAEAFDAERARTRKLHRRTQAAESELSTLQRLLRLAGTSWASPERRMEAADRDRQMNAVAVAAAKETGQ